MRSYFAHRVVGLMCVAATFAGAAAAQPAPITYAGQGGGNAVQQAPVQTASADPTGLAGGDSNSYGYGQTRQRQRSAVIDIRRSTGGARAEDIAYTPPQADDEEDDDAPAQVAQAPAPQQQAQQQQQRGQGAPAWLEQERVGPPYEANGRWYVPTPEPGYEQTGTASWYGPQFNGQRTASGEAFDQDALTAAHPTLPIPSLVQVTNLENGKEVIVRVNDRGPFVGDRLIDLSHGAAQVLGFEQQGQTRVHIRYLGPAPRRVNPDGTMAAVTPPVPPVQQTAEAPAQTRRADAEEGPASLLPPRRDTAVAEERLPPVAAQQPQTASLVGGYFVQVGAFSDLANAHRVRAEVLNAGPVVVDTRQTANGELFRVRVGPWGSREEADAARQQLAQMGYGNAIVAAR